MSVRYIQVKRNQTSFHQYSTVLPVLASSVCRLQRYQSIKTNNVVGCGGRQDTLPPYRHSALTLHCVMYRVSRIHQSDHANARFLYYYRSERKETTSTCNTLPYWNGGQLLLLLL